MRSKNLLFGFFLSVNLFSQTYVDLRTQAKGIDFSGAQFTRPMQTGTALPPACVIGQTFFKTDAPVGRNIFGCVASNVWMPEGGQSGLSVYSGGAAVASGNTLNLMPGMGLFSIVEQSPEGTIVVRQSIDTATVQTPGREQSGKGLFCDSTTPDGRAYVCSLTPVLPKYTTGMSLRWRPGANAAGGSISLSIDTLNAVPVKLSDGVTDPSSFDVSANRLYSIWFDGAQFRIVADVAGSVPLVTVRPACGLPLRGRVVQTAGQSGQADSVSICLRDAAGSWIWKDVL